MKLQYLREYKLTLGDNIEITKNIKKFLKSAMSDPASPKVNMNQYNNVGIAQLSKNVMINNHIKLFVLDYRVNGCLKTVFCLC